MTVTSFYYYFVIALKGLFRNIVCEKVLFGKILIVLLKLGIGRLIKRYVFQEAKLVNQVISIASN